MLNGGTVSSLSLQSSRRSKADHASSTEHTSKSPPHLILSPKPPRSSRPPLLARHLSELESPSPSLRRTSQRFVALSTRQVRVRSSAYVRRPLLPSTSLTVTFWATTSLSALSSSTVSQLICSITGALFRLFLGRPLRMAMTDSFTSFRTSSA